MGLGDKVVGIRKDVVFENQPFPKDIKLIGKNGKTKKVKDFSMGQNTLFV